MRKGLEIIGLVLLAVLLGVSFQAVYGPQNCRSEFLRT